MLRWSINLFRVRGIQVAIHFSFLLLLAYAAWGGYQDAGLSGAVWESAVLLGFFACIVLHELGHSLTAMRYGVVVRRILLMPIGGMAEFDVIPRSPRQELLITVAGPAVNFAIAAALWLLPVHLRSSFLQTPSNLSEYGYVMMWWNLYIGFFNLVPAFPMDGGRILRALLAFRLPYARATFWAATTGKVICVVGILFAALQHPPAWLVVALFLFILGVGEMEYRSVLIRERREAEWEDFARRLDRARHDLPPQPPFLGPN